MESKRKNVYIVIFVITTIIASCLAIYLYITGNSENEKLQAKINELNSTNIENNDNNVQQNSNNVTDSKFSTINYGNLGNNCYISKSIPILNQGIKVKVENKKAFVAILDDNIGTNEYTKEKGKYYEIQNVNGNVVDIAVLLVPTSSYPIFVLLMEDGTMQKTKIDNGSDIICEGKIDGFENIVGIESCETVSTNDFGGNKVDSYTMGVATVDENGQTKVLNINELIN